MTIQEARTILGDLSNDMSDEYLQNVINFYTGLANNIIDKHLNEKGKALSLKKAPQ